MNKKIISLALASALILSAFTGCNNNSEPEATTTAAATTTAPAGTTTTAPATEAPADTTASQGGEENQEGTVNKIADAIKAAYGESYLPQMPVEAEMASTVFGLEEGTFTEFFAETPMISAQVDTLLIVKAAEGKAGDVKAAVDAYRQRLLDDTMQYPMNVPKIQASQVVQNGDYVAFILLGGYDDTLETDEQLLQYAEEQTKIGVDAFNNYFA